MTHYCTACSSEFNDDSGALPNADCVHCVFCGARIPLRRSSAPRARATVVPFSKDYEREEAFALGVINPSGPGFPDTLRQFRVRTSTQLSDSLTPLAHGSGPPPQAPTPRKVASLSLSLSVGFAVGVAIAFAAVSLLPHGDAARSVSPAAAAPRAATTEPRVIVADTAATPAPTPPETHQALVSAAAPKPPSAEQDRRWLLDRARSEQRQYRITTAERLYRQILAHAPRDSEALSGLGELDLLRGTVDLADAHFQEALNANANYIPALIAAADIRWQSGHVEEARQAYQDIVDHYSADLYPPYVALRSAQVTLATAAPLPER